MKNWICRILLGFTFLIVGCSSGNVGGLQRYSFSKAEPEWIRNGEALEFEGQEWYPHDNIDVLTDDEVSLVGKFNNTLVFVENTDVRPYDRLYTKFGVNQFRVFKPKPQHPHDKG